MCREFIKRRFRNANWIKALIMVLIFAGLVLGVGLPIFAPLGVEAFLSWASIVVVIFAIWISIQSLNLTRETQRPFLTIVGEPEEPLMIGEKDNPRIILHIKNTGNLPADRISVLCVLYTANEKDIGQLLHHAKTALAPPIYFPGVVVGHTYYLEPEQFEECKKGKYTIRVLIKYENKVLKRLCNTQRSLIYDPLTTTPMSPKDSTHRDDWWD